jgi:hypothetical protein
MKYILIQNDRFHGEVVYTPDILVKERSNPGSEIWFLPDSYRIPTEKVEENNIEVDPRPFPNDIALEAIRNKRDALLVETDWVVLSDISLSASKKQEYFDYRQALRDLPSQFIDNPNEVVWPTKP